MKLKMLQAVDKKNIPKEVLDEITRRAVKWVIEFEEVTKGLQPNIALNVANEGMACIIKMLVSNKPEELRKAVKLVNRKLEDDMEILIKAYENKSKQLSTEVESF